MKKLYFYSITVGDAPLVTLSLCNTSKKNASTLFPNAPSTFLWAMSDAHSWMIHYFESILFGLIKPVNRLVTIQTITFTWVYISISTFNFTNDIWSFKKKEQVDLYHYRVVRGWYTHCVLRKLILLNEWWEPDWYFWFGKWHFTNFTDRTAKNKTITIVWSDFVYWFQLFIIK